jgi:hypothetical protein
LHLDASLFTHTKTPMDVVRDAARAAHDDATAP